MIQYGWNIGAAATTPIDNLSYNYSTNSNKLLNVIDANNVAATKLGDFRTSLLHPVQSKTSTTVDYTYDGNGNLVKDLNKDIGLSATDGIAYNYLNLPQTITVYKTGSLVKGTIAYTYDASGNKLKKVTTEGSKITTTLYLGGFNYVNDSLQYAGHEEGRIRPKTIGNTANGFVYDYMLKDHLGNVRMVLTDQLDTAVYPMATLETAKLGSDTTYYSNITSTRTNLLPVGYPANTPAGNQFVAKLNGSVGGKKIGPAITLKVMAGDRFNVTVNSYWTGSSPQPPNSLLTDLLAALSSGAASAGGKAAATEISSSGVLSPGASNFLSNQNPGNTKPKAYLNWVLLDEQFKVVLTNSSFEQVGASGVYTTHTKVNMPVDKNGYLYIYVSNETPNIDVYFDNLQVSHVKGSLIEESHFMPFGLRMEGISSRAADKLQNKYGITGKEMQIKEFSDGTGLEEYDFGARFYDPQIARWHSVDLKAAVYASMAPYQYCLNNPILIIDPNGMENVIYLVGVEGASKSLLKKLQTLINKAFADLKLETRVKIYSGKNFTKDVYNKLDKTDAVAIIGNTKAVINKVSELDSKMGANLKNDKDFGTNGGADNPEESSNPKGRNDASDNIIAINTEDSKSFARKIGTNQETLMAYCTVHGAGHNSSLPHNGDNVWRDGESKPIYDYSIMADGNYIYMNSAPNKIWGYITSNSNQGVIREMMIERFGNKKSEPNNKIPYEKEK